MAYQLGVDLGTTYTAAAVHRDGRTEMVTLGNRAPSMPSVVYLGTDATILTGEAASRRGVTEPGRIAREFKRRLGDPTPLLVGGTPYSAEALMARLLRGAVDAATALEGEPPSAIAVCHPANWGAYKLDLLLQGARLADLEDVVTVTEPVAAAVHYASAERIEPGELVAVYDLGGGTFDACVLRRTDDGFELLGEPEGIERLGGIDFDQAVFAHVVDALGGDLDALVDDDPASLAALARLRQDCVEAKEALSSDTEVSIPVLLPKLQTEVRLTRAEFEAMVRPSLTDSIGALRRALRSAGVEAEDLKAVLLVGGSSRIPLVSELVSQELRRPVAVDAHPKHAVALGAALVAAAGSAGAPAAGPAPDPATAPMPVPEADPVPVAAAPDTAVTPPPSDPAPPLPPGDEHRPTAVHEPVPEPASPVGVGGRRRPVGALVAVGVAVVAVAAAAFALAGRGDDRGAAAGSTGSTTAGTEQGTVGAAPDGGGSDPAPSTTEAGTGATSTTAPATSTTESGPAATAAGMPLDSCPVPDTGPFVCVDEVFVDGEELVATFTVHRVDPHLQHEPLPPASRHLHFFFDTTDPDDSGAQSPTPGSWRIWDDRQPFRGPVNEVGGAGYLLEEVPEDATALCVLIADANHRTTPGTGACRTLPPEARP